jgi:hypothetical protein
VQDCRIRKKFSASLSPPFAVNGGRRAQYSTCTLNEIVRQYSAAKDGLVLMKFIENSCAPQKPSSKQEKSRFVDEY